MGDLGEKIFKLPQSCFACQPPLDRGGLLADSAVVWSLQGMIGRPCLLRIAGRQQIRPFFRLHE